MSLKDYKNYRETGKNLMSKILKKILDKDNLEGSFKLLDVLKGKYLLIENDYEMDVAMDFSIHEYTIDNKTVISLYEEKFGGKDKIETDILKASQNSYTSLFSVISVSSENNTVTLNDVMSDKKNIILTDIGLSTSLSPGLLIFTRIIPFNTFNMTSGVNFIFDRDLEYILRQYRKFYKKSPSNIDSIKRFIAFFKINKMDGIEVRTLNL
jgi:hypothetical protein